MVSKTSGNRLRVKGGSGIISLPGYCPLRGINCYTVPSTLHFRWHEHETGLSSYWLLSYIILQVGVARTQSASDPAYPIYYSRLGSGIAVGPWVRFHLHPLPRKWSDNITKTKLKQINNGRYGWLRGDKK